MVTCPTPLYSSPPPLTRARGRIPPRGGACLPQTVRPKVHWNRRTRFPRLLSLCKEWRGKPRHSAGKQLQACLICCVLNSQHEQDQKLDAIATEAEEVLRVE